MKKFLVIALALVLVVSSLVACKSEEEKAAEAFVDALESLA